MNRIKLSALFFAVAAIAFIVGSHTSASSLSHVQAAGKHRVRYYRDPMHPAYKSDKPGIAPDCGMKLEPMYEEDEELELVKTRAAGAVMISPERQQLIGIRVARVEKTSGESALHFVGRVAADETRLYRITAAADGWIQDAKPVSTDSLVKKGERLAEFYSPEFLGAEQAYIFALRSLDRFQNGNESADQIALTKNNVQQYADTLRKMGMSESQIEDLSKSRQITQQIWIVSPVSGMVLMRNIWPGQRFERGAEFFRIADLSRIWVVADVYDSDWNFIRPGTRVAITQRSEAKTFAARVSSVLPQFDPGSRTLKLRLEAENPNYLLRPDMFVDVDIAVAKPSALTVPVDAVLESGSHEIVWVCRGDGVFEPREVRTGTRSNERVEIIAGLSGEEEIAVSGNFLLDSESRMRMAEAERPVSDQADSDKHIENAEMRESVATTRSH